MDELLSQVKKWEDLDNSGVWLWFRCHRDNSGFNGVFGDERKRPSNKKPN